MPNSPDEIAALRDEVEALRAQLAEREHGHGDGDGGSPPRRGGWWRAPLVGVLLALVAILSPLSVVAAWAHAEVSSTDRYVNTVTPLATHPAIQEAIIDRVTSEIFARIDIPQITDEAIDALAAQGIPSTAETGLRALAVPLDNAVQNFVREQVTRLVESQAFEDAWIAANRQAHEQLVVVLTGEGTGDVDVSGGTVSVNLAALIDTVKQTLVDRGFNLVARLPTINASFVIFESDDLTRAQGAFDLLDKMSTILPILTLILLAVAVAVARNRRRTVIAGFLCIAFGMILLGLALAVFRSVYLDAIPTDQIPTSAAAAVYDTLVGLIRMNIRGILFVALIVAFVAWVSGPTATASPPTPPTTPSSPPPLPSSRRTWPSCRRSSTTSWWRTSSRSTSSPARCSRASSSSSASAGAFFAPVVFFAALVFRAPDAFLAGVLLAAAFFVPVDLVAVLFVALVAAIVPPGAGRVSDVVAGQRSRRACHCQMQVCCNAR